MTYSFDRRYAARHTNGAIVTIPDQVASDQRAFDGRSFPVLVRDWAGRESKRRAVLRGDLYGLWTAGAGDCVVSSIAARG